MTTKPPGQWGPRRSRWFGKFFATVYWATEIRGAENVPRDGAAIIVGNHVGIIDGPVLHGALPRPSHFLVTAAMFKGPVGLILKGAGQIKVEGEGRSALAQGLAVLRRGGVVGVFPEGTRGAGGAESVHGGAAWLAVQSGAPVIPAALLGTRRTGESVNTVPRPRRRMLVSFGEPVRWDIPSELKGRAKQAYAENAVAQALRDHLAATLAATDLELPLDNPDRVRSADKDTR